MKNTIRLISILVITSVLFSGCHRNTPKNKITENSKNLNVLYDEFYEGTHRLYPLNSTFYGDNRYNDLLPNDISQSYIMKIKSFYEKFKEKLSKVDSNNISTEDKINLKILNWECSMQLESFNYKYELLPVNQYSSLHLIIDDLAGGKSAQPFKTSGDYENWLKRLDAYEIWCDTAIANMRRGMKTGYVLPAPLVEKMIPQLDAFCNGPIEKHVFYEPIKNFPSGISSEDKIRLEKEYREAIENKVIPMHKRFRNFLRNEYLPSSRKTAGYSDLPDGKKMYEYYIRLNTTTNLSADEIFNIGTDEVARITKEMELVKNQVGFKGDNKSFFNYVRNDQELMPYKKPKQVLDHFKAIHEKIAPKLKQMFDIVPKTQFEIRETESFREASASAEYQIGLPDGSRPGILYIPVPDAMKYNNFMDEDLFLHEGIPGHHYQLSLQMENQNLPKFRRELGYTAYTEGWALYTESLGKELGLYTDPYQYLGMLSNEIHRAIRLVVDVGIHAKGWTREQAIEYSLNHEAESESSIVSEIERYMAAPGQALAYKIGQLKILELRAKAEKSLGSKFDLKEFHDIVLQSGSVPLRILEINVNNWLASKK